VRDFHVDGLRLDAIHAIYDQSARPIMSELAERVQTARPGALDDQSNAGAVMWLAGAGPLLLALLWCVADWGARERRLGSIADGGAV